MVTVKQMESVQKVNHARRHRPSTSCTSIGTSTTDVYASSNKSKSSPKNATATSSSTSAQRISTQAPGLSCASDQKAGASEMRNVVVDIIAIIAPHDQTGRNAHGSEKSPITIAEKCTDLNDTLITNEKSTPNLSYKAEPSRRAANDKTSRSKDLFEHSIGDMEKGKRLQQALNDPRSTLVVLGTESGGKTTVINCVSRNLEVVEPDPTLGIDFSFVRAQRKTGDSQICHIWKIGGDSVLDSGLIQVPFDACPCRCLPKASVFLVVDLSRPELIWTTVHGCVVALSIVITRKLNEMGPSLREKADEIMRARMARISQALGVGGRIVGKDKDGEGEHKDKASIEPLPIPWTIVAMKYDLFEEFDDGKKQKITYALRLLAHYHGALLIFVSNKNTEERLSFARIFDMLAFERELSEIVPEEGRGQGEMIQVHNSSVNQPEQILFGSDSYSVIDPALKLGGMSGKTLKELVGAKLRGLSTGGDVKTAEAVDIRALARSSTFKEPDIDELYERELIARSGRIGKHKQSDGAGDGEDQLRSSPKAKGNEQDVNVKMCVRV